MLISYVGPNIASILATASDEVVGVPDFWINTIHPDERESARRIVNRALRELTAHVEQEFRQRIRDGR